MLHVRGTIDDKENYEVKTRNGMSDKFSITIAGKKYAGWGSGSDLEKGFEVEFDYDDSTGFNDIKQKTLKIATKTPEEMCEALNSLKHKTPENNLIKDICAKVNELSDRQRDLEAKVNALTKGMEK